MGTIVTNEKAKALRLNNLPLVVEETLSQDSDAGWQAGRQAGSRAMLINRKMCCLYLQKKNPAIVLSPRQLKMQILARAWGLLPAAAVAIFCSPTEAHWPLPLKCCACSSYFLFFPPWKKYPTVLRTLEMWLPSDLKYRHNLPYCFGIRASETAWVTNFS